MDSLYIVREFVNDLQSIVQLPNNDQQQLWMEVQGSSSFSVPRGKQARKSERESSFFQCPYISPAEGVAQIKGCRSPTEGVAQIKGCRSPTEGVAQIIGGWVSSRGCGPG